MCDSLLVAQELASGLLSGGVSSPSTASSTFGRSGSLVLGCLSSSAPVRPTTNSHHEAPAAKASSAGAWMPGSLYGNFCKNCPAGYDRLHEIAVVGALQLAQCLYVLSGLKFGL